MSIQLTDRPPFPGMPGPNIKPRRFERRPVLVDTNTLRRSLSPASGMLGAGKYWVEVGSNLPYADVSHAGGDTSQAVTATVKKNLSVWLKKIRGKAKKERAAGVITAKTQKASDAAGRLEFLFHTDKLETHHAARPFVGITPQGDADIRQIMTAFFKK